MAHPELYKLVVDTNVLVRAFANRDSASGRVLQLCKDGRVMLLLSRAVMREYREVLARDEIVRGHPAITAQAVKLVVEHLRYIAELIDPVRVHFRYDRDPDDECFIELAISGNATHILTHDRDLLALPQGHAFSAKQLRQRLPGVEVLRPQEFLGEYQASGGKA